MIRLSPTLVIGKSHAYIVQPYFFTRALVNTVYINVNARVITSPTELIILGNTEQAQAQPAMIFNAVLEYHI